MSRFYGSVSKSQDGKNQFVWVIDTSISDRTVTASFKIFSKGAYTPYYSWNHTVKCVVGGNTVLDTTGKYPNSDGSWVACSEDIGGTTYKRVYTLTSGSTSVGNGGGSVTSSFSYSITGSATYLPTKGTKTVSGTDTIAAKTGSFNLNILLPDGSEPHTTGAAGSVEFSSDGGGSYTRLYNEPSGSYVIGTSFVCRNFSPGTGLYLSGTSGFNSNGGSGPWYASQGSSTTVSFQTAWNTYYRDINAWQPGATVQGGLLFDYFIYDRNGNLVNSYYNVTNEVAGTVTREYGYTGKINNIRPNVTGAHYTTNNVTNNGAGEFTWTYNNTNSIDLYSAWNTHTITIRRGTGISDITSPAWSWTNNYKTGTVTYGQSFNINVSLMTGYHWINWTGSFTTSTQNYTFTIGDQDYDLTANGAPNTYTIAYNANGGSGAPGNQTKTYNSNLTLSSTKPTRANYDFLGWSTSNTATSATYAAGDVLNTDLSTVQGDTITLYAVWRESKPTNLVLNGTVNGPFQISLSWANTGINISYKLYANGTEIYSGSGTSYIFNCAEETTYNFYYTATNKGGTSTSSTLTLTTPADQAKIRIKKDGVWQKGKTYYKKDGRWVKAKKIYVKVDGQWKINNNYDN